VAVSTGEQPVHGHPTGLRDLDEGLHAGDLTAQLVLADRVAGHPELVRETLLAQAEGLADVAKAGGEHLAKGWAHSL
jgi:hypothetical protein